jgi:hypothetical protein
MKYVINYVLNSKKTNASIYTGINVNPDNAFNEMVTLKKLMGKADRRLWYHFVQSFPLYDDITPELALQVANETAEYFREQYQIIISVHTDKKHIHTHFVMNTVNIETGRKYTQNNEQRIEIQTLSDKICEKYGLHVLSGGERNNGRYKKPGQYRAEQAGIGWKANLKAVIDDVLSIAVSRVDFIRKMEQKGYKVKWSDTRKNITFTTPTGMRCRDRNLGESDYYNKQNFEIIFEQNAQNPENDEHGFNIPIQSIIKDFAVLFNDNADLQAVFDGFMLGDVDFDNMSWKEIEDTIVRLRRESETRKSRALANQAEAERKAAEQAFAQTIAMLDELEKWLVERKSKLNQNDDEILYDEDLEIN